MPDDLRRSEFRVANLDCENEAAAVRRGLEGVAGVAEVSVYPGSAKVTCLHDPAVARAEDIQARLTELGFPPRPEGARLPSPWRNPRVLTSLASGLLLLLGWLLHLTGAAPEPLSLASYVLAMIVGGYYFGREAAELLLFERRVGIEFLMALAAIVAAAMGHAVEGASLVFLYSISEAAEGYTGEKTRSAIRALMDLTPKTALVRRDGRETEIPVSEVRVGDIFLVAPGQSVPTDGVVVAGASDVDEAPVTGESVPVEKTEGSRVFAGSINCEGALDVRATKTAADNTIARIIHMVEEAQENKGRSQRFIERFGRRYSPTVLLIGALIAVVPPLVSGSPWSTWVTRATVFIVAAAPCALAISIPITLVASLGTGARKGVLVKGGVYIEELAKVTVVALDKTGTVTRGRPEVTDVVSAPSGPGGGMSGDRLLSIAAGIEGRSEHPLAEAIVRHAGERRVAPAEVRGFQSFRGAGASGRLGDSTVYIGSPTLFDSSLSTNLDAVEKEILRLEAEGKTVVVVGDDREVYGLIALRDELRSNARRAIEALRGVGVERVVMLTGDNAPAAEVIARELGLDAVYADLRPEDKAAKVRDLMREFGHVAMVGDGVNDAPALAAATVGVAMGAIGTDVALETADVALMADDLDKLVYALRLARRNQAVVSQNLWLSVLVIGGMAVGAVIGAFSLPVAILGHELSEFIVIGSGLRMLRA